MRTSRHLLWALELTFLFTYHPIFIPLLSPKVAKNEKHFICRGRIKSHFKREFSNPRERGVPAICPSYSNALIVRKRDTTHGPPVSATVCYPLFSLNLLPISFHLFTWCRWVHVNTYYQDRVFSQLPDAAMIYSQTHLL